MLELAAQTHAAARDTASRLRALFAQWQQQPGGGSLAERLGVTASEDMSPRVAALPEFWYAKPRCCGACASATVLTARPPTCCSSRG